jgi:DNA-binding PadR family transcriptional regulator
LERDGLVAKADTDSEGHVYYAITAAGHDEVTHWLDSPVVRTQATRDELAIKLAIAVTLPGVNISEVIQVQRAASLRTLQDLTRTKNTTSEPESSEELAWMLVVDSMIFAAEAEVRWLDHSETRLARASARGFAEPLPLSTSSPKRGRPVKTDQAGQATQTEQLVQAEPARHVGQPAQTAPPGQDAPAGRVTPASPLTTDAVR